MPVLGFRLLDCTCDCIAVFIIKWDTQINFNKSFSFCVECMRLIGFSIIENTIVTLRLCITMAAIEIQYHLKMHRAQKLFAIAIALYTYDVRRSTYVCIETYEYVRMHWDESSNDCTMYIINRVQQKGFVFHRIKTYYFADAEEKHAISKTPVCLLFNCISRGFVILLPSI